jgi:hypothetical protein
VSDPIKRTCMKIDRFSISRLLQPLAIRNSPKQHSRTS